MILVRIVVLIGTLGFFLAPGVVVAQSTDADTRAAAEAGDMAAQFSLALTYMKGGDPGAAVNWLLKAADQGHAEAPVVLGIMYREGEGVAENDAEAVKWFRMAADQGHATAQVFLGSMYDKGEGVPENDAEAVMWYRKAADQGHAGAQANLGVMYDNGEGVAENDAEAVKWYRMAADQGNAGAQFALALMYDHGEGVPEDDAEAYFWLSLAAANGTERDRQYRDEIKAQLTPAVVAEVQARTAAWRPKTAH